MAATALATGVGGGLLGTCFQKTATAAKGLVWGKHKHKRKRNGLAVGAALGLLVGLLSRYYPQTLFWGEGSLQCAIDGQATAFAATGHGLPAALTAGALVDPSLPFAGPGAALQVGAAKLAAIVLASAGKFPGGIIFPLFFAAAPCAHAIAAAAGAPASLLPVAVMSLMAATQAAVTRTPLASVLILALSATAATELSTMMPACLIASYVGVFVSQILSSKSYFQYDTAS